MVPFKIPKWVTDILEIPREFKKLSAKFIDDLKNELAKFSIEDPVVSIVMPVYNEEENLVQTLYSLSKLDLKYKTELIIVNNNSNDGTQAIIDVLGLKFVFVEKQGISYARQAGLEIAKGKYHLCVDGDALYHTEWLNEYIKALKDEKVTVVYGPYSFIPLKGLNRRKIFAMYEILTSKYYSLRRRGSKEFINVLGFNFGFRTADGKKVGGFNTTRPRWSDGWMAMSLQKLGSIKFINNEHSRVWTTARRLNADGSLLQAFFKRVKRETPHLKEHINKINLA